MGRRSILGARRSSEESGRFVQLHKRLDLPSVVVIIQLPQKKGRCRSVFAFWLKRMIGPSFPSDCQRDVATIWESGFQLSARTAVSWESRIMEQNSQPSMADLQRFENDAWWLSPAVDVS